MAYQRCPCNGQNPTCHRCGGTGGVARELRANAGLALAAMPSTGPAPARRSGGAEARARARACALDRYLASWDETGTEPRH